MPAIKLNISELTPKHQAGDIENAFNEAMNTTNKDAFVSCLEKELPAYFIYTGGNHIAIHKQSGSVRLAIIENI